MRNLNSHDSIRAVISVNLLHAYALRINEYYGANPCRAIEGRFESENRRIASVQELLEFRVTKILAIQPILKNSAE